MILESTNNPTLLACTVLVATWRAALRINDTALQIKFSLTCARFSRLCLADSFRSNTQCVCDDLDYSQCCPSCWFHWRSLRSSADSATPQCSSSQRGSSALLYNPIATPRSVADRLVWQLLQSPASQGTPRRARMLRGWWFAMRPTPRLPRCPLHWCGSACAKWRW